MTDRSKPSKSDAKAGDYASHSKPDPRIIMDILKDPQTLSKINYILTQKGIPTTHPCLRIEVDTISDQQTLELEAEDLQKLFSTFGPVESVTVLPTQRNIALVSFKDIVSAYFAQQTLHLHCVQAYQARLSVKWNIPEEGLGFPVPVAPDAASAPTRPPGTLNASQGPAEGESVGPSEPAMASYRDRGGNSVTAPSTAKYTCRFEIQIENDKEFQVARRLIGSKGCNMKKIIDMCSKGCAGPVQEVIKLRLRGKGSGFKEGPNQQESDEPLHLCVSSPYFDKYMMACELAKELITGVYTEYRTFCERMGKSKIPNLQIKMIENVAGIRNNRTGPSSHPRPPDPASVMHAGYYPSMGRGLPYYCSPPTRGVPYYYPPGYPPPPQSPQYYAGTESMYRAYGEAYHFAPSPQSQSQQQFYSDRPGDEGKDKGGYYYGQQQQM